METGPIGASLMTNKFKKKKILFFQQQKTPRIEYEHLITAQEYFTVYRFQISTLNIAAFSSAFMK